MYQIDEIDKHLISLLQMNARESVANLSRALGMARTTILARIQRLEKNGVIAGYGVRLAKPIEQHVVRAYSFISVHPKMASHVIKSLSRLVQVEELSAVSGQFDYLILFRCQNNEELDQVLDSLGMMEGVLQTQTSIVLSRRLDRRQV